MTYALYEIEDKEAVAVHFYCCLDHAILDELNYYGNTETEIGVNDDWPDGTVCEHCNNPLV